MPWEIAKLLWAPATRNSMQTAHLVFCLLSGAVSCKVFLAAVHHSFSPQGALLQTSRQGYRKNSAEQCHTQTHFKCLLVSDGRVPSLFFRLHVAFPLQASYYYVKASPKNADCFYLTDKDICCFKMSSIHFRWFTRNRFYFNTYFLAFFCNLHWFMVYFNTCNYSNFNKL